MKALRLHSVRLRLTLWNVGVLALTLAVLGVALRYAVQDNLVASLDQEMMRQTQFVRFGGPPPPGAPFAPPPWGAPGFHPPFGPGLPPPDRRFPGGPGGRDVFRLHFLDLRGHGPDPPWDMTGFRRAAQGQIATTTVTTESGQVRVLSVPIRHEGHVVGVVQDGRPLDAVEQEVGRLTRNLLTLIPLALLIAGLGGAFLTDRALRPVRQITRAAGRIGAENLSGRLPVTADDEFAELASTFNAMLARLEAAFEQQRRFTADASHELRTPLTVIKAQSSLALSSEYSAAEYRQALEAVDRAADRTGRIVQDLLMLARADAGQTGFRHAPTRLADVLEQAAAAACTAEPPPIGITLSEPGLRVTGDAEALIRLFGNLFINAVRHTPPTGRITVSARPQDDRVAVTVADTGEGIAPEHLPHIFERFYRVDAARSRRQGGTGLGLAICKTIVDAHGGSLAVTSTVGRGTTIQVLLPRA